MSAPEKDLSTLEFIPTHYLRVSKEHPQFFYDRGVIEYTLTEKGIEDPGCTICPVMFVDCIGSDPRELVYIQPYDRVQPGWVVRRNNRTSELVVVAPVNTMRGETPVLC